MCLILPVVIRSSPLGFISRCKQGIGALVSRSMTLCLVFALLDVRVCLWIWWGRSDSAALMGLLFQSVAYSAWHGTIAAVPRCDVRVWWAQVVVVWYRVSCEEVIHAICPLCLLPPSAWSPSCHNLCITLSYPPLSIFFFFGSVPDRFQGTFTCSDFVKDFNGFPLRFFAEARYCATFWSVVFQGQFYEARPIVFQKKTSLSKWKFQSLFAYLHIVSKPVCFFFFSFFFN